MILYKLPAVWGITEPKPWREVPAGKVRIRMRAGRFASAFVKTPTGITEYYIMADGDFWVLGFKCAQNIR